MLHSTETFKLDCVMWHSTEMTKLNCGMWHSPEECKLERTTIHLVQKSDYCPFGTEEDCITPKFTPALSVGQVYT